MGWLFVLLAASCEICQYRIKNPQNQRLKFPHYSNSGAEGSGKIPAFFLASSRYESPLILNVTE